MSGGPDRYMLYGIVGDAVEDGGYWLFLDLADENCVLCAPAARRTRFSYRPPSV